MQPSDEPFPTPGRPSLLSLDQQAEADRHRILAELDEEEADLKTGPRGMFRWIAIGGVVAALSMVGGVLLSGEEDKPIVPAVVAASPAMQEPAVNATAHRGPGAEVNEGRAAPLLDDEPIMAAPASTPVLPLLLDTPTLVAAPVKHAVAPERVKPARAIKTAKATPRKKVPKSKPKALKQPRTSGNKQVTVNVPTPGDTEVALLAALVTHSKATQAKNGVAAKLKQCKSLVRAVQRTCRMRVCAAVKGAPECKSPLASRTGFSAR